MSGVRIQHTTERNVTFTLVDGKRPYQHPIDCPVCHRVHTFKTYHIALDETGAAIVSLEIAERIKALPNSGFAVTNEVRKPPPLIVGLNGKHPPRSIVTHRTLKEPR